MNEPININENKLDTLNENLISNVGLFNDSNLEIDKNININSESKTNNQINSDISTSVKSKL